MRYPKEKSFWLLGLSGWILSLILITPAGFQSESGLFAVMLFAVWVLVGWGIALLPLPPGSRERKYPLIFPGAFLLSLAFTMERGTLAGLLSISWLLTLSWFVFGIIRKSGTLSRIFLPKGTYGISGYWNPHYLSVKPGTERLWKGNVAGLYLLVGALWAVLDRFGWRPLNFEPVIVALTAMHFHFAGFLLLVLTLNLEHYFPQAQNLSWAVLTGVLLVAIGITNGQLGGPAWVEVLSATFMALSGMGVALLHMLIVFRRSASLAKSLPLFFGSLCLFGGMILALLYGWRFYIHIPFLSIPWMQAVHGTFNALGLTLLVFYWWKERQTQNFHSAKWMEVLSEIS